MKTSDSPSDEPGSEVLDEAPRSRWTTSIHAARPARPLSDKSAALQARRRESLPAATLPLSAPGVTRQLRTPDGALSYALRPVGSALYLERTQRRPLGTRLTQCIVFASLEEFLRWCEAEPLRFESPVLHQRLRRHGEELLHGQP